MKNQGFMNCRGELQYIELLKFVDAKNTKAVQVGGASGICVPKSQFDRTFAYEDAATGGSIMIFNESTRHASCS